MFDQALGWVGAIAEWFGRFFPRWQVIDPTCEAMKLVCVSLGWSNRKVDHPRIVLQKAGLVWWWPCVTDMTMYPVKRQANDLRAQTIVTTDGKTYVIAGIVVYGIHDLVTLLCGVHNADSTICEITLGRIHDACVKHSAETLEEASRSGKLDIEMRQAVAARLKPLGVTVHSVTLTDMAPCRVFRLVNSEPADRLMPGLS